MCHQDQWRPLRIGAKKKERPQQVDLLQSWGYDWRVGIGGGRESEDCTPGSLAGVAGAFPGSAFLFETGFPVFQAGLKLV